jgi:hypothetical protein
LDFGEHGNEVYPNFQEQPRNRTEGQCGWGDAPLQPVFRR